MHALMHRLQNADLGMFFVRVAVGVVFINAGWMKLSDMSPVVAGFAGLGFPVWLTYIVAYCEFLGGLAVLLGVFARYAGIILAIIMFVAIWKVHGPKGFSLANGGYEYNLVLLLSSLAIVTLGAGKYSLARLLRKS